MGFADHRTNPSSVARTLIHERIHSTRGNFDNSYAGESRIDAAARSYLKGWGLGRGGCPAVGGYFGYWPDQPGC
jgi:hypothetical protein